MALFLSTFINKIDRKGRVSVPAPFRAELAGQEFHGIVAIPSFKTPALQCGGMDWMERLSAGVNEYDMFSEEQDMLSATLLAAAQRLALDGDGRIVLPESLIAHANLGEQAAFVGRGKLFEIWEPEAFSAHQDAAVRSVAERGLTLRPATDSNGNGGGRG